MAAPSSHEWPSARRSTPAVTYRDALVEEARQQRDLYGAAFMTFEINMGDPMHHCIMEVESEYRARTYGNPGHDYGPLPVRILVALMLYLGSHAEIIESDREVITEYYSEDGKDRRLKHLMHHLRHFQLRKCADKTKRRVVLAVRDLQLYRAVASAVTQLGAEPELGTPPKGYGAMR